MSSIFLTNYQWAEVYAIMVHEVPMEFTCHTTYSAKTLTAMAPSHGEMNGTPRGATNTEQMRYPQVIIYDGLRVMCLTSSSFSL